MKDLFLLAINAAIEAGKEINRIYNSDDFDITIKTDNSPLTKADKAANSIITSELKRTHIPIISEENKLTDYNERKDWKAFWMVDPLDGTKEFIKKNGEFTVNIALIRNKKPIFGVIYVPVKEQLYFGCELYKSFKTNNVNNEFHSFDELLKSSQEIPQQKNTDKFRVVASKSHFNEETKNFIDELEKIHENIELVNAGSSLKLCLIAEGSADIYPRFAPTMEWDIAAGHAIVKGAGGSVKNASTNEELVYNKENLLNPYFIVKP